MNAFFVQNFVGQCYKSL